MDPVLDWLLESDEPALRFQVERDLLGGGRGEAARRSLVRKGACAELLARRGPDGHWGKGAYVPKWTCTHYVLHELTQLGCPPATEPCRDSVRLLLAMPRGSDGGINYARTVAESDVCVNGMLLHVAAYFGVEDAAVGEILDYLLRVVMPDGGWNCEYLRGARHSSLHTTVAVLEGLLSLRAAGATGGRSVDGAVAGGVGFLLAHRLYRSSRSGEIVSDDFFRYCFPVRWKYDILRCLDLFRSAGLAYDPRMEDALARIAADRDASGRWKARSQPGKTYLPGEANGAPGRWNTLRALRVLSYFGGRA